MNKKYLNQIKKVIFALIKVLPTYSNNPTKNNINLYNCNIFYTIICQYIIFKYYKKRYKHYIPCSVAFAPSHRIQCLYLYKLKEGNYKNFFTSFNINLDSL